MESDDDADEAMRKLEAMFKRTAESMQKSSQASLDALKAVRDTVNAAPEMMSYSISETAHEYGTKVGAEIAESISSGMDKFAGSVALLADKQLELSQVQLKLFKYQAKALLGVAIILGLSFILLIGLIVGNILQWNMYIHSLPHAKPVAPVLPLPYKPE